MPRAPYKYLDYYTFEDADLFFGREEETQKMVGEILSTRLLVLFSPSGSGKTSLINAGVRPALEKIGFRTAYVRLDKDPIPSVQSAVAAAVALLTKNEESHSLRSEESLLSTKSQQISLPINRDRNDRDDRIQNDDLHGFFKKVTCKTERPLVVFIDQFEEFFIVFENQPQLRQRFIEQIAKIKYDDQLPVFLVVSLREDYFANLHEFREAIPSIFQNNANIRLEPFTEAEARRAIEEPVKVVGCEYEAGLVEHILQDLKNGKPGIEPITLQIVCNTVWEEKPAQAQRLTFADYKAAGGADHILSNYVSCFLDNLSARQQSLMAKIFEVLKTPDDTKRYRTFEDLQATLKLNPSRLKRGLDQLVTFNLLRQEARAGTNWYEFKHDYLVREIAAWLRARRERLATRRLWYGLSPGVALLLGLLVYLFIQYNSFYAGTVTPENVSTQEEEIAIFRNNPFHLVVVTTGYRLSEVRGDSMKRALKNHFIELGFQKDKDWGWLASTLDKVEGGIFAYRLGELEVALEALLDALKDSNPNVRYQAAAALGEIKSTDPAVIKALLDALKDSDYDFRRQAAAALGEIKSTDPAVIKALLDALKDSKEYVRRQAAGTLGKLLQPKLENELLKLLANSLSGYRTAGAQALARKDSLPAALLNKIDLLRQDVRPWVRLAAWDAYELIQVRLRSEAEARKLLHDADSVLASSQLSVISKQYANAFNILKGIIRVDSAKAAYAKFQQARCEVNLKNKVEALDNLRIAFEYNPTLRDTLQAEMANPENDWKILEGNSYLREVLLKTPKTAPK